MAKANGRRSYSAQARKPTGVVVPIFQGLIISLVVSVLGMLVLSVITLTSDSTWFETYLHYILVVITLISIFIGSVFATSRVESRALIVGMTVGAIYVLFSVGIGLEISNDPVALPALLNKLLAGLAAGGLGGVVGINL